MYHLRDHVHLLPPALMNHPARKDVIASKSFGALLPQDTELRAPSRATPSAPAQRTPDLDSADEPLLVNIF